ncbi:MAG: AAA family ATPase [Dehalococcoidia bacterium]|nr:AAA family ATPase [Dehalococcoidia bacterium]
MSDIDVLQSGYRLEVNPKNGEQWQRLGWSAHKTGAGSDETKRLLEGKFIELVNSSPGYKSFRLTEKGRGTVLVDGNVRPVISAARILEKMEDIVGWDELKLVIASTLENEKRVHFLLSGPPACAKSLIIEAVRQAVPHVEGPEHEIITPGAEIAFGSRTSASGLSDLLFGRHPLVLLLDEIDKVHSDVFSVLLGLMETGEVIETKSKKTRGVRLATTVIAAGNSISKIPAEVKSRFGVKAAFPPYTRDEFINICRIFLIKAGELPGLTPEIAETIGSLTFDYQLGDIRTARDVTKLMESPTLAEAERVIQFLMKYSGDKYISQQRLV